jgi:hypothetical protein
MEGKGTDVPQNEREKRMASKLPSLKEAARKYNVSYWTVYLAYRRGQLATKRVGHSLEVSTKDVERLLDKQP